MTSSIRQIVLVGKGRLGTALFRALRDARYAVLGPLARGDEVPAVNESDVVLLCVPDAEIASAAKNIPPGPLVAHCAGSLALDVLGDRDGFSLHPLLSITGPESSFDGAACAIAARTERSLDVARELGRRLHMDPIEISDENRPLYHAAASMASNYLVTLESAADRLASAVGVERHHLVRLASSALDNWSRAGESALTGPIVRGDEATVKRQREAVVRASPELAPLWDALADATRTLVSKPK